MPAVTNEQLEGEIAELERQISLSQQRSVGLFQQGLELADRLVGEAASSVAAATDEVIAALVADDCVDTAAWEEAAWRSWEPDRSVNWHRLRAGEARDTSDERVVVPAYVPFIGTRSTVVINTGGQYGDEDTGVSLLQSLLVRTALALPHEASYTLLDPSGAGRAFPMRRLLPNVRATSDDVRRDLDEVNAEIRRIIETYLDASTTSFELIPEDLRLNERFHFVFAANYPNGYDLRAVEALQAIANTGPDAGVYLFVHHNHDVPVQGEPGRYQFDDPFHVVPSATDQDGPAGLRFGVTHDRCPDPALQESVFAKLAAAAPVERKIDWNEVLGLAEDDWWLESADRRIITPVGKHGANKNLELWFGSDPEGRPCVHGMVGAMSGAGKSTLFHVLIAGLTTRYSPEELRLYLIDGKFGVEFEPYMKLPHAEVVSLKTAPELSRSVLAELVDEMKRRNAVFQRNRVADLPEYRALGQPDGAFPRILLVVDEYQQLFEGDRDDSASTLLRQISEQGRSAGIHMLLASQRFGATGMINQTAIFGNIHLRMAMQMSDADVKALSEFGPRGRNLIQVSCNMPGKIVVNDRAGDDNGNVAGKIAFLDDEDHEALLAKLIERAEDLDAEDLPARVVFNGEEQPDLLDNPVLARLMAFADRGDPAELEQFARREAVAGGLGISDWFAAEQPLLGFLGQEYSVRGQARVVLRRRGTENIAVVGGNNAVRFGMLAGLLGGLSAASSPSQLRFMLADHSVPGSDWYGTLAGAAAALLGAAGFEASLSTDDETTIGQLQELLAELHRREDLPPAERAEQPALVWVVADLDRSEPFRKVADEYGLVESETAQQLRELLTKGPAVGVHTIASFDGVRSLCAVLDDKQGLAQFRHRVGLQMSEDDSFLFTRGRLAAQLQATGDTPVSGLYLDTEHERVVRFKPYSVVAQPSSSHGSMADQLAVIGGELAERPLESF